MCIFMRVRMFNMQKTITCMAGTHVFIIDKMRYSNCETTNRDNNSFEPTFCKQMARNDDYKACDQ